MTPGAKWSKYIKRKHARGLASKWSMNFEQAFGKQTKKRRFKMEIITTKGDIALGELKYNDSTGVMLENTELFNTNGGIEFLGDCFIDRKDIEKERMMCIK